MFGLVAAVATLTGCKPPAARVTAPTIPAASQPTPSTAATSQPTTAPLVIRTYAELIRQKFSHDANLEELSQPLELRQAAHLRLAAPVYLSGAPRPELWISHPAAPPLEDVFAEALSPNAEVDAHLVTDKVLFVHWMPVDSGPWVPYLICEGDSGLQIVWPRGHKPLASTHRFDWRRAMSWNQHVVVPTDDGISLLDLDKPEVELHQPLWQNTIAGPHDGAQTLLDTRGLLAWIPWNDANKTGGQVFRYVDDHWIDLTREQQWPTNVVHLVPLLDGSVVQLLGQKQGQVRLAMSNLDRVAVDEAKISALVDQLADLEEQKRNDAYQELLRYGPGIWPLLEKLAPDQPPEAQARLQQLLKEKQRPTLGGFNLLGRKALVVASRLADGGVVFYADQGVSYPDAQGQHSVTKAPAWLAIRPDSPVQLLPDALTSDLKPGYARIWAIGNEWIVSNDVRGPRRFLGNGFETLLRKDERGFDDFVGVDHRGRWLFQHSGSAAATQPTESLLLDPTYPDPTPRLPGWEIDTATVAGWDKHDWPAIQRGSAYALHESEWELLDNDNPIETKPSDLSPEMLRVLTPTDIRPGVYIPATIQPTSRPAVPQVPMLWTKDGTKYFDGQKQLVELTAKGDQLVWPLPDTAVGQGEVHLVRTPDGLLFLFNQSGRVLRIRPVPGGDPPFKLEAVFTRHIPSVDSLTRVWLDPAGRVCLVWQNHLTILFPRGYIPKDIADKMLDHGDENDEP